MSDRKQNEQNERELVRDLDVPDGQAEAVKGGVVLENVQITSVVAKPPLDKGGGTANAGWDLTSNKKG